MKSWVDLLQEFAERVPLPFIVVYGAIGLVGSGSSWIILNSYGVTDGLNASILSILVGIWLAFPLAYMHFADQLAARSLKAFRPALGADDAKLQSLNRQLTTMPGVPLLVTNVLVFVSTFLTNFSFPVSLSPLLPFDSDLLGLNLVSSLSFAVIGGMMFHTVRQLALIRRLYERARNLTVFQREETYAFSNVSAFASVAWAGFIYITVVTLPGLTKSLVYLVATGILVILILSSVLSLLVSVNRKLVKEKAALRKGVISDLNLAYDRLHAQVAAEKLDGIPDLRQAISAMVEELGLIDRLSTWPWQRGTLAGVMSALLLPALVVLVQELTRLLIR